MIGSLRGNLLSKSPSAIIVEAAGVGYQLHVPTGTLSELPDPGREVFLHVYTSVREDAIQLFGFGTEDEKRVFTSLLGIKGIGPKLALNIVSGISHAEFIKAVEAEDIAMLSRIPGLGKKTAGRVVLELKGRLPAGGLGLDGARADAVSALENLGYRKADARMAVEKAAKAGHDGLEALLKESLKYLTGGLQ